MWVEKSDYNTESVIGFGQSFYDFSPVTLKNTAFMYPIHAIFLNDFAKKGIA